MRNDSATNRARAFSYIGSVNHAEYVNIMDKLAYEKLHFGYFLVHFFHELDDKVDELMFQHSFSMEVGDEKRYVIALSQISEDITIYQEYQVNVPLRLSSAE